MSQTATFIYPFPMDFRAFKDCPFFIATLTQRLKCPASSPTTSS